MPESTPDALHFLTDTSDGAANQRMKLEYLQALRQHSPDMMAAVEDRLVLHIDALGGRVQTAEATLEQFAGQLDKLTQPPWILAEFVRSVSESTQVVVQVGPNRRMVALDDGVAVETLRMGDEVFLNSDQNLLVRRAPWIAPRVGHTARFVRYADDDRVVISSRDEEIVAEASGDLREADLEEGDTVRWSPNLFLVREKIVRPPSRHYILDSTPRGSRSDIGGLNATFESLTAALSSTLVAPEIADKYHLTGRNAILMVGPPGCGKTLMARTSAAEIESLTDKQCHFAVVKPAEWENPYVGQTQAHIRDCFASLNQLSSDGSLVVLFLDEVEAIGRARGHVMGIHNDKFVAAFLAELDGFVERGNVAVIAATNRKDLLDPALLERLSDIEVRVPRPNREAANDIFSIHLPADMPFSPNGNASATTRQSIIDLAVSRFFDPNADNLLCHARFRDGSARAIAARELISGRVIMQVCRDARFKAHYREMKSGESGVQVDDMDQAVQSTILRLSTVLTRHNIHSYLSDLPQDIAISSVEPVSHSLEAPSRYLNASY